VSSILQGFSVSTNTTEAFEPFWGLMGFKPGFALRIWVSVSGILGQFFWRYASCPYCCPILYAAVIGRGRTPANEISDNTKDLTGFSDDAEGVETN